MKEPGYNNACPSIIVVPPCHCALPFWFSTLLTSLSCYVTAHRGRNFTSGTSLQYHNNVSPTTPLPYKTEKKNKPTSKNPSTTTATNRNRHNGLIHCLFFFIFYSLSLIDVKLKTTIYGLYGKSRTGAVPVVLSSLFLFFVVRNWPSRGASTVWTWRNLADFV